MEHTKCTWDVFCAHSKEGVGSLKRRAKACRDWYRLHFGMLEIKLKTSPTVLLFPKSIQAYCPTTVLLVCTLIQKGKTTRRRVARKHFFTACEVRV